MKETTTKEVIETDKLSPLFYIIVVVFMLVIAYMNGVEDGKKAIRAEAIDANVAEYSSEVSKYGCSKVEFKWK